MTDDLQPIDPHGLLTSGEELATEAELARLLSVPRNVLNDLLRGALYEHVRYVRMPPGAGGPWRYSVADALRAIAPHRAAIAERRRKADEHEAAERAAAAERRVAKTAAPKPAKALSKPAQKTATAPRRAGAASPVEVVVRRRPGA